MGSLSATWIGNNKLDAELYNHVDFKQILLDDKEPEIINLAFMCFSIDTNSDHRGNIYNYYNDKSYVTNLCKKKTGKYLNDDEFIKNAYNHYFVICPFGNGIDCGRTWMALQLGSIPIMQYHICFKDWANNLPIILYNDIQEITEEFLLKKIEELKTKTYNYDYLKTSYWKSVWDNDKNEISQLT